MEVIIIGAGPVGLAAALLLADGAYKVTVYEGRLDIPADPEQSYPIGVNPRGINTIEHISNGLAQIVKDSGEIVDSWQIFGGTRRVALQQSRVVYGTSRGQVNLLLYQECCKKPKISILFGYKLIEMDFASKSLTFDCRGGKVDVDARNCRVIGADGLNSAVRRQMAKHVTSFSQIMTPWTFEFRVLFGPIGMMLPELDSKVHYIFSGWYSATIDYNAQKRWAVVTGFRDHAPQDIQKLLTSDSASPENIMELKSQINSIAPLTAPFFENNDGELSQFFKRRSFRGAIVECNRFNQEEWIVLVGDAAHSVIPPTGEGINSGLEDVLLLAQLMKSGSAENAFQTYSDARFSDIKALVTYAKYLNLEARFPGEGGARLMFMIFEGMYCDSISKQLFGPDAAKRLPYGEIVGRWSRRKRWILPVCRIITYPFGILFWVLSLPFRLMSSSKRSPSSHANNKILKLPVGEV